MSEILLCNQSLSPHSLKEQCGISIDQISAFGCTAPTMAAANTPYMVSNDASVANQNILSQFSPGPVAQELTSLALSFGGDNVIALAEITAQLKEYNVGLMGASASVYASRVGSFAGSVQEYQSALMEYRQAVMSNSPTKIAIKNKAHVAFQKMQDQFRNELKVITGQIKSRRGSPLSSANRATNIAESSRNVAKLNVTNQIQANNIVKLSKQAKFLGGGLAVIDFGGRAGSIHTSYKAGGDWERDMFIESSSFAASAITGTVAVNAGAAVLTLLIVATPVGWVGLIIGGATVAASAAGASIWVNGQIKENSGDWYDGIMGWIN
jgi:hypothetical protein